MMSERMGSGATSMPLEGFPERPQAAAPAAAVRTAAGSARRVLLRVVVGVWLTAGAVLATDAFLVEPNWIQVRRSVEYLRPLRSTVPDVTLVHLSDLHIGQLGMRERRAIDLINQAHPDLIVITGDLTRSGSSPHALGVFLSSLHARHGVFMVWGNHDHWDGAATGWGPEVVRGARVTILDNESRRIDLPRGHFYLAGVDDPITGHDNLRRAMAHVPHRAPTILLAHTPEIVRSLGHWGINLVLAGHTHGGQVRLPWIGALWVPYGTRDFLDGWFDVDHGARLHVNPGLGMSWLPVRFLCRPVIDLITLRGGLPPGSRPPSTAPKRS
jgi:uncharacterized protein